MRILLSGISGLLWGIGGSILTREGFGAFTSHAAPSGALIGVIIYFISRWSYRQSIWLLIPVSVATTFLATALFGVALGFADLSRGIPRIEYAVVLQAVLACVWGLVFIPVLWLLFPLAFCNHLLIRTLERKRA